MEPAQASHDVPSHELPPTGKPSESPGYWYIEERGVGFLTLSRPPVNVLDLALLGALSQHLETLSTSLKALVLCGEGRAFCAGMDIADHFPERAPHMLRAAHTLFERLLALPCPLVAVVDGPALGGGCEILLTCDVVLATSKARFGFPEVRVGALPPFAAVALPLRMPWTRAFGLLTSGRTLSPQEALELGLVSERVEAGAEHEALEALLAQFRVERPAGVVRVLKQAMHAGGREVLLARLRTAEQYYCEELLPLEDAREGLVAFQEKRAPVWRHA